MFDPRLAVTGVLMAPDTLAPSLHEAIRSHNPKLISAALQAGAHVDERNAKGQTPLLMAVWNNDMSLARLLLAAGADVNAKDYIEDSPYLVAGAHGRLEILKLLVTHGADLKSTTRYGGTALIPAAQKGHPETVSFLIEAGVDINHVNHLGWTALLEAVLFSGGGSLHQDIVRRLLKGGANKHIPDKDGLTALEHAKRRGFEEMVRLLE